MGNYNPHAPYILGQEWVPIRQANLEPETLVERGYVFSVVSPVLPVSGAYYVAAVPEATVGPVVDLINVYPSTTAELSGPVHKVNIPVSGIAVTGASFTTTAGFAALNNPSDQESLRINAGASVNGDWLGIHFDLDGYSQQLFGKRILNVKFRYALKAEQSDVINPTTGIIQLNFVAGYINRQLSSSEYIDFSVPQATPVGLLQFVPPHQQIFEINLWNYDPFWNSTVAVTAQRDVYPWRYPELARFRAVESLTSRLSIMLRNALPSTAFGAFLYFADLEITYCEETRVLYGGVRRDGNVVAGVDADAYELGPQFVRLLDTNLASATTTLTPRDYLVTLSHVDTDIITLIDETPSVYALRELYQLPNQRGTLLTQSWNIDDQLTRASTDVLTHITLHTAAGVVTGVHAYGALYGVPVHGSTSPIQEIEDDPVPTAKAFPQVRFYARRFGNTTVPLTLVDVATGLSTVSIAVADFDALPEIVDGWREVNLRFATAPVFSATAGDIDWKWTAAGESVGNQWQILAASGPSPTGAQTIGPATYYAPQGNTVDLTWMSPNISGTAEDTLGDAVLLFSQDPSPVSGFAISTASQVVTGIALDCGTPPGCVPTGIGYINLAWSQQTFLPVTGFGAYELERLDLVDGTWTQIMNATAPTVTGFTDFEARVGQTSWYRIRTCNVLDFCGPWVTGSATLPSPGVAILGGDGNSVLIFTSNEAPGSNLAYTMQWEGQPVETFTFPEASEQQLQRMFGKDFFTVFRPLERGGETFTRVLLVNAAAIPLPSLANFRRLRDLAWADLPYVCVRDELGNRWYANVLVPDGTVRQGRTIYLAQVQVTQVTNTPSPSDPAT